MAAARTMATTLGFVGLGHMGGNMAARYLAAGFPVYGEARSREHAQHLVDAGLSWCDTPREVAEAVERRVRGDLDASQDDRPRPRRSPRL